MIGIWTAGIFVVVYLLALLLWVIVIEHGKRELGSPLVKSDVPSKREISSNRGLR